MKNQSILEFHIWYSLGADFLVICQYFPLHPPFLTLTNVLGKLLTFLVNGSFLVKFCQKFFPESTSQRM